MKGKVKAQLLLKKMKSSPDISWNEKGELKYKGETVQGSNVQPTRMGNIRRSLTRSKCSTRFDWSRGPMEIHQSDEKNTEISQTTT
jgi:hypothetical protein